MNEYKIILSIKKILQYVSDKYGIKIYNNMFRIFIQQYGFPAFKMGRAWAARTDAIDKWVDDVSKNTVAIIKSEAIEEYQRIIKNSPKRKKKKKKSKGPPRKTLYYIPEKIWNSYLKQSKMILRDGWSSKSREKLFHEQIKKLLIYGTPPWVIMLVLEKILPIIVLECNTAYRRTGTPKIRIKYYSRCHQLFHNKYKSNMEVLNDERAAERIASIKRSRPNPRKNSSKPYNVSKDT